MVPWKNNIWKVTQSFQVIWKSPKESSLQFLEEVCQILRELLVWSNACPLSHWCHPTILSSVVPFSFCLPSFPASGTFPMSWLFKWDGQSIGASTPATVFPVNNQGWFPLRLTDWLSLQSKGPSRVFSSTTIWKHQFGDQSSLWSNSHIHTWLQEKQFCLHGHLPAKWCLCFLICCLDLAKLSFQGASVF